MREKVLELGVEFIYIYQNIFNKTKGNRTLSRRLPLLVVIYYLFIMNYTGSSPLHNLL